MYVFPGNHSEVIPLLTCSRKDEPLFILTNDNFDTQHPIIIDDIAYPCVETFIQIQKFLHPEMQKLINLSEHTHALKRLLNSAPPFTISQLEAYIRGASTAEETKKRGAELATLLWHRSTRHAWRRIDLELMRTALRAKLDCRPSFKNLLQVTGKACIIYDNYFRPEERFWGWGAQGQGDNNLGILLMEFRNELHRNNGHIELEVDPGQLYKSVQFQRAQLSQVNEKPLFQYAELYPETIPTLWRDDYQAALRRSDLMHVRKLRKVIQAETDNYLKSHSRSQQAKLYETQPLELDQGVHHTTSITVINKDCLYAALDCLEDHAGSVCVLNMAAQYQPGGKYKDGVGAQEADLMRRTSLSLDLPEHFYAAETGLGENVIFSPNVTVIREGRDGGYRFIPEENQKQINIISSAPFDLNDRHSPKKDSTPYLQGMRQRIINQFNAAYTYGQEHLFLTAFGCGSFGNDAETVANLYSDVLQQYQGVFKTVTFAIIAHPHKSNSNLSKFDYVFHPADGFAYTEASNQRQCYTHYDSGILVPSLYVDAETVAVIYYEHATCKKVKLCCANPQDARQVAARLQDEFQFPEHDVQLEHTAAYIKQLDGAFYFAVTLKVNAYDDFPKILQLARKNPSLKCLAPEYLALINQIEKYERELMTLNKASYKPFWNSREKGRKTQKYNALTAIKNAIDEGKSWLEIRAIIDDVQSYPDLRKGKQADAVLSALELKAATIPQASVAMIT